MRSKNNKDRECQKATKILFIFSYVRTCLLLLQYNANFYCNNCSCDVLLKITILNSFQTIFNLGNLDFMVKPKTCSEMPVTEHIIIIKIDIILSLTCHEFLARKR